MRQRQDRPDFEHQKICIKEVALQVFSSRSSHPSFSLLGAQTHDPDVIQLPVAFEADVTAIMSFILAMLVYPEAQRKAQQEIDSVVGFDRLPDFTDKENLPYVTAVIKEVLR